MKKKLDWGVITFLVGYHLALLIGLPIYFINHAPSAGICITSAVLLYISGMAITSGYHRLYSHSTYKTHPIVEVILLFLGTLATQGSALKWASDHRKHHAFVDTDRDPYSIKKGFWHAHFLWLFEKAEPIDQKVVADLMKNRMLVFQHKFYAPLMFLTNGLVTLLFGYLFNDYLSALVFVWGVRLCLLHHFTWFINSAAHSWGKQNFSQEHSAVDNFLLSIFTFGEGYHNYHHTFANDYRNGVYWYQFDPSKWLIWLLSKCKLAHGLRKVSRVRIQECLIAEQKQALIEKAKDYLSVNLVHFEEKIEEITKELLGKFASFSELLQKYKTYKAERQPRDILKQLSLEIKSMKKTLKADWKSWQQLSRNILDHLPHLEKNA